MQDKTLAGMKEQIGILRAEKNATLDEIKKNRKELADLVVLWHQSARRALCLWQWSRSASLRCSHCSASPVQLLALSYPHCPQRYLAADQIDRK